MLSYICRSTAAVALIATATPGAVRGADPATRQEPPGFLAKRVRQAEPLSIEIDEQGGNANANEQRDMPSAPTTGFLADDASFAEHQTVMAGSEPPSPVPDLVAEGQAVIVTDRGTTADDEEHSFAYLPEHPTSDGTSGSAVSSSYLFLDHQQEQAKQHAIPPSAREARNYRGWAWWEYLPQIDAGPDGQPLYGREAFFDYDSYPEGVFVPAIEQSKPEFGFKYAYKCYGGIPVFGGNDDGRWLENCAVCNAGYILGNRELEPAKGFDAQARCFPLHQEQWVSYFPKPELLQGQGYTRGNKKLQCPLGLTPGRLVGDRPTVYENGLRAQPPQKQAPAALLIPIPPHDGTVPSILKDVVCYDKNVPEYKELFKLAGEDRSPSPGNGNQMNIPPGNGNQNINFDTPAPAQHAPKKQPQKQGSGPDVKVKAKSACC
ncbi:unnamed protein product [Amoebophrya sp. A120]|nr:unnamed protein product [Amoebophrya sp. A120]|eukprot:GSA120T00022023001.1